MTVENEWVLLNRHLQKFGTATCDAGNLLVEADEAHRAGQPRAAHALASAARAVVRARAEARSFKAASLKGKRMPRR